MRTRLSWEGVIMSVKKDEQKECFVCSRLEMRGQRGFQSMHINAEVHV